MNRLNDILASEFVTVLRQLCPDSPLVQFKNQEGHAMVGLVLPNRNEEKLRALQNVYIAQGVLRRPWTYQQASIPDSNKTPQLSLCFDDAEAASTAEANVPSERGSKPGRSTIGVELFEVCAASKQHSVSVGNSYSY